MNVEQIRKHIKHPIVDADGHWVESPLILADYVAAIGGGQAADQFLKAINRDMSWYGKSDEQRLKERLRRPTYWIYPMNAKEQATFRLPALLHERMDEIGIDFSILYPTLGLGLEGIRDPDLRSMVIRAYNTMTADLFKPYASRIAPVAIIPRRTPKEAVAELNHAVKELGFKAVMISGTLHRRSAKQTQYVDALGLDNLENYDPLWASCVALKVAVTSHAGSSTWSHTSSVTNYVFNHLGHFALANQVFAKALFLGGVAHRFPQLNFGFLEGGTGWARSLYCDLRGHYEKRNRKSALHSLDTKNLDREEFARLVDKHARGILSGKERQIVDSLDLSGLGSLANQSEREVDHVDDFAAAGITSKREIGPRFARQFYFGCEADDPMTAVAFDARLGAELKAMFSSDIGHWDVPDVLDVLPEAFEMVEHGLLDDAQFKSFAFANAVRLHGGVNPDFFTGTVVESQAAEVLAAHKDNSVAQDTVAAR